MDFPPAETMSSLLNEVTSISGPLGPLLYSPTSKVGFRWPLNLPLVGIDVRGLDADRPFRFHKKPHPTPLLPYPGS